MLDLTTHPRPSSAGPSRNRVLTRRQSRAIQEFLNAPQQQQQHHQQFDETQSAFNHTGSYNSDPQMPNVSPQHPDTPASAVFSPCSFTPYPSSRQSCSSSNDVHPRSTSPVASVVPAATSLSSSSTKEHTQSRPHVSSESTGCAFTNSFPSTPDSIPVAKKHSLQNKQRKEICQYYKDHPNVRQDVIADIWDVDRSTISKILKNKNRWLAVRDDGDDLYVAKQRPAKFGLVEDLMTDWLKECKASGTLITDAMIRNKARECAHYTDEFKASAGWVVNYKRRAGIKKGVWVGRDPGFYDDSDEKSDSDDMIPYVYETREYTMQRMAMEEVERERTAQLNMSVEVPGHLSQGPSPFTIAESGSWPPLNSLAFGDNGSVNTSPNTGLSNSTNEVPPNPKSKSLTAELQHHYAAGGGTSSAMNDPPPVSPQEASKALNTVLRFIDAQKPDFLSERERNTVTDVKHHIWLEVFQSRSRSVPTSGTGAPAAAESTASCVVGDVNVVSSSDAAPSVKVVPGAEQVS